MPRFVNPDAIAKPQTSYAHGVIHAASALRIVASGQLGIRPDGTLEDGLDAQMERAWLNLIAIFAAEGFERHHIVKTTSFCTVPNAIATFRRIREKVLEGATPASTYLQVAGLARPEFLFEVEGEAVKD